MEYAKCIGDYLVRRYYANKEISEVKIKNRKDFLQMIADAEQDFLVGLR